MTTYSSSLGSSSRGSQLCLIDDTDLPDRVLRHAAREVEEDPSNLLLWGLRCAQIQKGGRLGYSNVWHALFEAAVAGGAREGWARSCLFHAFGCSNVFRSAPPDLGELILRDLR
jgi:hypothetical protein